MISKSLSTSEKRAALFGAAGRLAEFSQALYPLIVAHADDYGRLQGDPFSVKFVIDPASRRPVKDFEAALRALHDVGLIVWYDVHGKQFIQVVKFDEHQQGLHRRTSSEHPAPPATETRLELRESDIEEFIATELLSGRLKFGQLEIVSVTRQRRIGNLYLDLFAVTKDSTALVLEVKRHPISKAAIDQVRRYAERIKDSVVRPFVIGHGLATGLQAAKDVGLIIYGDDLQFKEASIPKEWKAPLSHVRERQVTPDNVVERSVLTELNRTEQNSTEEKKKDSTVVQFQDPWRRVLGIVRPQVSEKTFKTWFEPCRYYDENLRQIVIWAPKAIVCQELQKHYRVLIHDALKTVAPGKDFTFIVKAAEQAS